MAHKTALLDPRISYGFEGGPYYNTLVVELPSGSESRRQLWSRGRYRWSLSYDVISTDGSHLTLADWRQLVGFFKAMKGRANSFLFWDPLDNSVTAEQFAVVGSPAITGPYQLTKTYTNAWGSPQETTVETITKPVVASTVFGYTSGNITRTAATIFVDGVPDASATVNNLTGEVTLSSSPAGGEVLTWTGSFDRACRFDRDDLATNYNNYLAGQVALDIIEDWDA